MAAPSFCFRLVSDSLTNPHRPLAPPRLSPQLDAHLSELSFSLEPSNSFDVTGVNVALAMAGLTFGVNELLDHPGTTFMRKALRAPLDVLTNDAARNLLLCTAALTPLRFREDAARLAADAARKTTSLSTVRGRLIARDLIYPAGRGLLRFRIPYFPEFVASSEGNLRTIS